MHVSCFLDFREFVFLSASETLLLQPWYHIDLFFRNIFLSFVGTAVGRWHWHLCSVHYSLNLSSMIFLRFLLSAMPSFVSLYNATEHQPPTPVQAWYRLSFKKAVLLPINKRLWFFFSFFIIDLLFLICTSLCALFFKLWRLSLG